MSLLVPLLCMAPLLAAAVIGVLAFAGVLATERHERLTSRLALLGAGTSGCCAIALLGAQWVGELETGSSGVTWFESGDLRVAVSFLTDRLTLVLATLFAGACWGTGAFAVNYMHREPGFHRFFFILSLFTAAVLVIVTSGNAVFTFIGWELSGFCSYLLVGYFHDRRTAAINATRVFVTNRVGDVGFLLGSLLAFTWLGSSEWASINEAAERLGPTRAAMIASCFALAAVVKSAQVPFAPWLTRAMEGPTPSSALFYGAVMIHGGIYLLLRLAPLLSATPAVSAALVAVGAVTAAYGFACGLVQTDMKSALAFSTVGQLGLMCLACGLGWSAVAMLHLVAHAVWRGYQFLTAPSIVAQLHDGRTRPVPAWLARQTWLYAAALHRGWLEDVSTKSIVGPVERFATDLARFDSIVIDRATGLPAPAVGALSTLAGWEEQHIGPTRILEARPDEFASGRGVLGVATAWAARTSDWFEDLLVVKTLSGGATRGAHRLGESLQWLEVQLERPAVVVIGVGLTLVALVSWTPR